MKKKILNIALLTSLLFIVPVCIGITSFFIVENRYRLPEQVGEFFIRKQNEVPVKDETPNLGETYSKLSLKTIYFIHNEDINEIDHILIELLNCKNNKIMFLTFPNSTKITVSNVLYQTMKETYVSAPQIMKLSMLTKYFKEDDAFIYGVKIIEDAFGIHVDNYSVMGLEGYEKVFTKGKDNVIRLKDEWLTWADLVITKKDMKAKMEEFYGLMEMDYNLSERLPYLETYEKIQSNDFEFKQIEGEQKNESFVPDIELIGRNILEFCQL